MVGKLNYSKWDNLELSDDSDVEVHPNVDKKSFIRWKQRDIHEKRDVRKQELAALHAESKANESIKPLLASIAESTKSDGNSFFSREVARLTAGRQDRGNKDGPEGPTIDDMILSLLLQIGEEKDVKGKQGDALDQALVQKLTEHQSKLMERQETVLSTIEKMEEEDKRKITSDNIREGWSSGYVNKDNDDGPEDVAKGKGKATSSTTKTTIETINAPGQGSSPKQAITGGVADADDEELPTLLPSMSAFAKLPPCLPRLPLSAAGLPKSFVPSRDFNVEPFNIALQHLSTHKELLREDYNCTDALLVEAFQSEMRGESDLARRCVEKALLVQYCNKLGRDGVNLFFGRMRDSSGKAAVVYFNDVLSTYRRIADRCRELQKEGATGDLAGEGEAAGEEQIQLVAEDESTIISFEVPDGPPPEKIELEGELADKMDVEQVRAVLQNRWDIYQSFSPSLRTALETKSLEDVNKVLGAMKVAEAEEVVGKLDQAGILNFSSSEVRDETGKS